MKHNKEILNIPNDHFATYAKNCFFFLDWFETTSAAQQKNETQAISTKPGPAYKISN